MHTDSESEGQKERPDVFCVMSVCTVSIVAIRYGVRVTPYPASNGFLAGVRIEGIRA